MAAHEVCRCARCGTLLSLPIADDSRCPKCGVDLHSCVQCVSFDTSARWECTQSDKLAARVAPKDARNNCPLFAPRTTVERQTSTPQNRDAGPSSSGGSATAPGRRSTICSNSGGCSSSTEHPAPGTRTPASPVPSPCTDREMSLLSPADQEKLRESFDEMTSPVRLLFFTQTLDCEPCVQTRQILDELPALSDKIAIEEVNFILEKDKAAQYGIDRVPALALLSSDGNGQSARHAHPFSRHPGRLRVRLAGAGAAARRRTRVTAHAAESRAGRSGHDADDDPGVLDPDLTALSAGGQPRA